MIDDAHRRIDAEKLRELAELRVVLTVPHMQDIHVIRNLPYGSGSDNDLAIDVYKPPNSDAGLPAVIFVTGYSDRTGLELIGLRLREWGSYVSWGQLVAASGLVGITYSCAEPSINAKEVLDFVRNHSGQLDIDPARIGIWATSGNGPTAISLLLKRQLQLRFAVMSNTYMMDLDGDTTVADMAAKFGFESPNSGKTVRDLDPEVPLFLVRSGSDEVPGLNQTMDRFISHAVEENLPMRFINLPDAPHGFDTTHNSAQSRDVIRQILTFMLVNSGAKGTAASARWTILQPS